MTTFPNALFDHTSGRPSKPAYVYHDPRIALAVNVALAARRPLLVTGPPGAGKSTLAADVASRLDWCYVSESITSRTRFEDLVARFDAVARLSDAQSRSGGALPPEDYLEPGVLWWAFAPTSAAAAPRAKDRRERPKRSATGTVVLLDEIDKAEPDLPNDLLEPLDRYLVRLPNGTEVRAPADTQVLVVLTSNGERSMPPAFERRCIALELDDSAEDFYTSVAASHFPKGSRKLFLDVARRTLALAEKAEDSGRRRPSVAEYLDTLRACLRFDQTPDTELWTAIEEAALRKTPPERVGP